MLSAYYSAIEQTNIPASREIAIKIYNVMFSAICSDFYVDVQEEHIVSKIISKYKVFDNLDYEDTRESVDYCIQLFKDLGFNQSIIKLSEQIPEEYKYAVLKLTCKILLADRKIEENERYTLSLIAQTLGVSEHEMAVIVLETTKSWADRQKNMTN